VIAGIAVIGTHHEGTKILWEISLQFMTARSLGKRLAHSGELLLNDFYSE
jgi:hypothetical protein